MELTANALQTVNTNQNVLFTENPVCNNNCSILHREGSGLVSLRGLTRGCCCFARFLVQFSANIAIPTGGTAATPISLAIAIDGEPVAGTTSTVTPAAEAQFNNVSGFCYITVPSGCCSQISIENVSTQTIDVQNANLLVERVA